MTHDELMARLDEPNPIMVYETEAQMKLLKQKEVYLLSTFQSLGINPNVLIEQNALINQLKAQIRAVVELHLAISGADDDEPVGAIWPDVCNYCGVEYPCPTIQAIEKESG